MSDRARAATIGLALLGGITLAGCGSSAMRTVSVPGASEGSHAATHTAASPAVTASPGAQPRSPAPYRAARGALQPSVGGGTRTAPGPAFTREQRPSDGLRAALAVLAQHGFQAADSGAYRPNQTLQVLIGTRSSAPAEYRQQAFFFERGRYLGTDASRPSGAIRVASQDDTDVTLAYALYRAQDAPCCPTGGESVVRFALDNGRLQALDPIPPTSSASEPSRR